MTQQAVVPVLAIHPGSIRTESWGEAEGSQVKGPQKQNKSSSDLKELHLKGLVTNMVSWSAPSCETHVNNDTW